MNSKKGALKVFLGMAAGVGKTYAMLKAAHNRVKEGVDLVIGTVDTHGRPETEQLLAGLPVIPEKTVSYQGREFRELDLDAILARRPQLVLVDELAHTTVPGSRHAKRWNDVIELLDAGIDVYTTLNVQHVESFKDTVEAIAGIPIRETVPDLILERATDIELVDLTPAELQQRLREGKVYTGDLSQIAIENFFQQDRLTALREISLRFAAEVVDQELHEMFATLQSRKRWKSRERLLVAINHKLEAQQLIRLTRRRAFTLHAPWIVLHVDDGRQLTAAESAMLSKNLALARDLGAEVVTVKDSDTAEGIQRVAEQQEITQIIIGKTTKRFSNPFKTSLIDRLIEKSSDIDVHLIRQPPLVIGTKRRLVTRRQLSYFATVTAVVVVGVISGFLAMLAGYQLVDTLLLGLILLLALLYQRSRHRQALLMRQERETRAMYEITHEIATAPSSEDIFSAFRNKVGTILGGTCELFIKTNGLKIEAGDKEKAVARWVFEHGQLAGWSTATLSSAQNLYIPLKGSHETIGVLSFHSRSGKLLLPHQSHFLHTIAQVLAHHMERSFAEERQREKELFQRMEKIYERVLTTLAEQLRLPLKTINGAIRDVDHAAAENPALATPLHQLTDGLDILLRVADNASAMAQLSTGLVSFQRVPNDIEELIQRSMKRIEKLLSQHRLVVRVEAQVPQVPCDSALVEILLINLLTNAVEYSPHQTTVEIEVELLETNLVVSVSDEGPGIPEEMMDLIFEKFYRLPGTTATGLGLGLAIASSIAALHQGSIRVRNRSTGGAKFSLLLPIS